ncbi:cupin domain-containing protein [Methylocystis heyeri]|uniref:Cupin domain-containing protein n=1 Tax=Methylocystis heyeri TaxID=391905 RepID=A0A6B8KIA4_9HYPH|nr:cupin domain-containing protein [Methylocystis heyeri]QGM46248.1 cupin domain-containing protein [Methylocystis heyeri]
MKRSIIVAAAALSTAGAFAAERIGQKEGIDKECDSSRPRAVAEVLREDALPRWPGGRVVMVRVVFPPGSCAMAHSHGGSVWGYVVSGTIRSQIGGEPVQTLAPGQSFFEPPGVVHSLAENASDTAPAEILAFHALGQDEKVTVFGRH